MSELRHRNTAKRDTSNTTEVANANVDGDMSKMSMQTGSNSKTPFYGLFAVTLVAVGVGLGNFFLLQQLRGEQSKLLDELGTSLSGIVSSVTEDDGSPDQPTVWIEGKRMETGYLRHVIELFDRLGYRRVNGSEEPWDVLWSHDYPFTPAILSGGLHPHQRINHYPGSGFITNKVSLATSGLKHIPKAFHLPKDKEKFVEYAKESPEKLWVKKSNDHRGIRIEDLKSIDLESPGTFVQEYIQKPFLIDGRKFDIGIYVTMTSLNPLRVFAYDSDVLLRFCAKDYYPFNSTDIDSYVVGDDYTPIWDIPSLKKYFVDAQMNMKETLNAYIRSLGKDPNKIWEQIEDSIRSVYVAKHALMDKMSPAFGSSRHFFEMVRFDFVVDEDLNIYVMEANMSPNLSSLHFAENKLLYEQVIFNVLSLAGIAQTIHVNNWPDRQLPIWNMMVSDRDLSVFEDICGSDDCHLSCKDPKCKVCFYCLDATAKTVLKDAFIEHQSKYNNKRLIPSVKTSAEFAEGPLNELQRTWFNGMCVKNVAWCA